MLIRVLKLLSRLKNGAMQVYRQYSVVKTRTILREYADSVDGSALYQRALQRRIKKVSTVKFRWYLQSLITIIPAQPTKTLTSRVIAQVDATDIFLFRHSDTAFITVANTVTADGDTFVERCALHDRLQTSERRYRLPTLYVSQKSVDRLYEHSVHGYETVMKILADRSG